MKKIETLTLLTGAGGLILAASLSNSNSSIDNLWAIWFFTISLPLFVGPIISYIKSKR